MGKEFEKESSGAVAESAQCRTHGDMGLILQSGKTFWRRKWQQIPVFLPENFSRRRSSCYSPSESQKDLDKTEGLILGEREKTEMANVSSLLGI